MRVSIYEVGPRDGLQSLPGFVKTEDKQALIQALYSAGLEDIEEVSFAHPKAVPQMADAEKVFTGRGSALVMNKRGFDRAMACGVEKVNVVFSGCEGFNMKNLRKTRSEIVHELWTVLNGYPKENVRVYLSMAFGSPYSGMVEPNMRRLLLRDAAMLGNTVVFADTVGIGIEKEVEAWAGEAHDLGLKTALHLHHRGNEQRALALVRAGLFAGIKQFDSSIGGLGGCPFAKGSGANLSTESLVRYLNARGFDCGVDLERLKAASSIAWDVGGKHGRDSADDAGEGPAPLVQGEVGGRQPEGQGREAPTLRA